MDFLNKLGKKANEAYQVTKEKATEAYKVTKEKASDISEEIKLKSKINSLEEKKRLREEIIGGCGSAIFVFGDYNEHNPNPNSGVKEEFEIALKNHKTIIPIAYPGMRSEIIWKQLKSNLTQYPYLEKSIDLLTSKYNTEELAKIVIYILDSVQDIK